MSCRERLRRFHTLDGPVQLIRKLNHCPDPGCAGHAKTKSPELEITIALPQMAIGWDVFCWIGHRRSSRNMAISMIQSELLDDYGIKLSEDAIDQYVRRYQIMLAARRQDSELLRQEYESGAEIILSIGGLQPEKGHETLYVVRELTQKRVWFADRIANGCGPRRGPGVAPTELGREKRGFAEEQLGRLSGCIQAGLDEVKVAQEVIREYVEGIAVVAATLEPGTEDIIKYQEHFDSLIDQFEATKDPIRHGMATVMLSFLAGLFVSEEEMKPSRTTSIWSGGFACPRVTNGGFTAAATRGFAWIWKDRRWCMPWTPTPHTPGRSPWTTCYPTGQPESHRPKPKRGDAARS